MSLHKISDADSTHQPNERPRYLRVEEVLGITRVSRATLWRWISAGRFPEPVRPSPRLNLWLAKEIDAWEDELEKRRAPLLGNGSVGQADTDRPSRTLPLAG